MANNVVSDQMKSAQVNSFTGGINTDLHPMLQPSDTLTDCVNGTLITYNGNENMLQNDMGNYALEGAKLPVNYVPIGVKEYAGILYIVAYNPIDKKVQVGSYPSPKVTFDDPGEGSCTIEITPYNIKQFVPSESAKDIDPFDVLLNEKLEGESEKGVAYHLHSNVVKSASNLLKILGDFSDSNFQLTINDQYKLVLTVDAENSEWMQSLKYFSFTKDGILEDITDIICVDSVETDEFRNVVWQSPGWLGVKYELADIVKSHQAINNVSYPTHGRTTNTLWTNEEEDSPTFGKIQVATGDLSKDFNYYEDPYVMIPEGNYMIKYYWNNVTPESNDTVVYYSKQPWQVSDEDSVISHFDDGNWHTVRFNGAVENIADCFSRFDYTDESLYVFLPSTAYIDESKNKLFGDSAKLFVFIHNNNDRNFTLKTNLKFINKTKEMRLHAEDVYIRELYCPIYDDSLYVSPEKVGYIIVNTLEEHVNTPLIDFANIITDIPLTSQEVSESDSIGRTLYYTVAGEADPKLVGNWFTNPTYGANWGRVELVDGIESIPIEWFSGNTNLETVVIPNCIYYIENRAFKDCTNLRSVVLSENLKEIGSRAFYNCSLEALYLPKSVEVIGEEAFANYRNISRLKRLILPNITKIGDRAFSNQADLSEVYCSSRVPATIGADVFSSDKIHFYVPTNSIEQYKNSWNVENVEGDDTYKIIYHTLLQEKVLWNKETEDFDIYISNSDIEITSASSQFDVEIVKHECIGNVGMVHFNAIPHAIKEGAFYNCNGGLDDAGNEIMPALIHIALPEGITTIESKAFAGCSKLCDIRIPKSVVDIATNAFTGCTSLPVIDKIRYADNFLVELVDRAQTEVVISSRTKWIGDKAFYETSLGGELNIPEGVISIGDSAFYTTNLEIINIPTTVKYIGDSTFANNEYLKTIEIPDNVVWCGNNIFEGCSKLSGTLGTYLLKATDATGAYSVHQDIKFIGNNAFTDNTAVTSVTMTNSVISISGSAFSGCSNLASVQLSSSIQTIASKTFYNCSQLTSITLPINLQTIGQGAFAKSGLTQIIIPQTVVSIGNAAFMNCSLTKIVISGNPTIGQDAFFANRPSVISLYYLGTEKVPAQQSNMFSFAEDGKLYVSQNKIDDFKSAWEEYKDDIEEKDFSKCLISREPKGISVRESENSIVEINSTTIEGDPIEIILPNTVTDIKEDAFRGCDQLLQLYIPDSVERIETYAFNGSVSRGVVFGKNVEYIGHSAFGGSNDGRCVYISDLSKWCNIEFEDTFANPLCSSGSKLYVNNNLITTLIIPDNVSRIKSNAFYGGEFDEIIAYGSIEFIGLNAFSSHCDIKLPKVSDNIQVAESAIDGATVYISPEMWSHFVIDGNYPALGKWRPVISNVYLTGRDSGYWLEEYGELKHIINSDKLQYVIPHTWQFRRGYEGTELFNSNFTIKQPKVSIDSYLDNIPTKYIYNVVSPLNAEPLNENIIGWRIDSDDNFKLFAQGDVANIILPVESVVDGQWLRITHKPYVDPETASVTTNICWKNGNEILNVGTGESLVFTVNAEARIRKDSWKEYDKYDVKWRLRLYAETNENKQYFAEFVTSVDDNGKLIYAPFYEKTVAIGNQGNFQELQGSFDFNAAIPEGLKNIYAESVFYCVETGVENPRVLIFDNTLQKDVLTLPEYVTLDYSDADIIGFTYDVEWDASKKQHNVNCVLNYNTIVDGFQVNAILSNINGTEQVSGDNSSGYSMEQTIKFECPETIQFAQLDVFVNGVNKFNKTILINSEINNPRWARTDMSTNDWGKVIDAILNDSENEWKLNVSVEVDSEAAQSEPCSYKVENSKLVDLTYYPEDNLPAKAVPIVDENGQIPGFEGYTLADIIYAPMKITATLGAGIQINGTISGATVKLDNGNSKYFEFGSPYTLGQKVNKLLPLGFNNVKLTADQENKVSGIPMRERLLKYMYRPLSFKQIAKNCGLSDDDIKLFDNYWPKNYGAVGYQDGNLKYDLWNLNNDTYENQRSSLGTFRDRLPLIFPVKFEQKNSKHGVYMPVATQGQTNVKVGIKQTFWHYSRSIEWPIKNAVVSVVNKKKDIWAIALHTSSDTETFKYAWFGPHSIIDREKFNIFEKEILLLGLAKTHPGKIEVNHQNNLYLPSVEGVSNTVANVHISIESCTCNILPQYSVDNFSTSFHISNCECKGENSWVTFFKRVGEYSSIHDTVNEFIEKFYEQLDTDDEGIYIPGFKTVVYPEYMEYYDGSDTWKEQIQPTIGYGRGFETTTCYLLGLHGTGNYETGSGDGPGTANIDPQGDLYPWPIRTDSVDIFSQIYHKFAPDGKVTINNETKTIDEWIKIYLKELVEELRYVNKYKNSN